MEFVKQFNGADEKFTFFEKANVNGDDARTVFTYLKEKLPSDDGTKDISWNFEIFLVDQEGKPVKRYAPSKTPYDNMKEMIESLLEGKKGEGRKPKSKQEASSYM